MMGKATTSGTTATDGHSPVVIKKSKSKKDPHPAKDLSETTTPKDSASSVTESKDLGTTPASEATGSQPKKVSKKKSKNLPKASPEDAEILAIAVESPKKSKKRKHRTENHDSQKDDGTISKSDVEEPPKKKHKNRTEFADPRADSTLNAQSRKALEYAFLQMNRPSKWKFNKARQNWLIRNIWNPDAISDIYFPFVLKYLINVQGGSREKLQESCQKYLKLPEVTETVQADGAVPLIPKSILKALSSTTKPTPGPLIDPSPTTGALIVSNSDLPPAATTSPSAESLAAIRRKRAQTLCDALCFDASASKET